MDRYRVDMSMKHYSWMQYSRVWIPVALLSWILCSAALLAQNSEFTLLDLDVGDFPVVQASFFLNDREGEPIRDLFPNDFFVQENNLPASVLSLRCPPLSPPERLSSVLAIDVSGSMLNRENIDIARAAANLWIDEIPLGYSDCAVTSFDDSSWINSDFTVNRHALKNAVAGLSPGGGTDYNAGLIGNPGGAVHVASRGEHRRVAIFLTDGVGAGDEEAIVQAALQNNVTLYAVVLRMPAPQLLKNVTKRTGGLWFENVGSREEAEQIYRAILRVAQGEEPCVLAWESEVDCESERNLTIEIPLYNADWTDHYSAPNHVLPNLLVAPVGTSFGVVAPNTTTDNIVTIKAANRPVTVTAVESNSPFFQVVGGTNDVPFVLNPNESRDLTIRFLPTDSAFRYGQITLISDACFGGKALVSGGSPGIRSSENQLRLLLPNGGEEFPVGSSVDITWEGVLPNDTVLLEYSADGGLTWNRITDQATGLLHAWTVPATPSNRCLMRITQRTAGGDDGVVQFTGATSRLQSADFNSNGNLAAVGGDEDNAYVFDPFTGVLVYALPGHQRTVFSVEFNPEGNRLIVGTGSFESFLWDVNTVSLQRTISNPSHILTTSSFSPDGERIVSHTIDGDVVVIDTANQLVGTLADPGFSGYTAHYSPDGSKVVSGGGGGDVLIWDVGINSVIHRIPLQSGQVTSAYFSPDGKWVVSTGTDDRVFVHEVSTGRLVRTIKEDFIVKFARYSPDGSQILIGGFHPDAHIRDAVSGELLRRLVGHQRSVASGDWSNDASRILTASWDGTARVWNLANVPYQSDVSDALWSIVEPQLTIRDVDMGRMTVGNYRDSVLLEWVCNTSTVPIRIDSITFSDEQFSLVSGLPPFQLGPGDCTAVEFRFAPNDVGVLYDSILVHLGQATLFRSITGQGLPKGLKVLSVDFGQVAVGSGKDSLVVAVVQNVSAIPLGISRTYLAGPDTEQFSLLSSDVWFGLAPGEMRALEFRFAPTRKGRASTSLVFEYDGVTNYYWGFPPIAAQLYGEGVCPDTADQSQEFGVSLPELTVAAPGEIVQLPLLSNRKDTLLPAGRTFSVVLRYNSSLLAPLDSAAFDVQSENDRVLVYNGHTVGESDTIAVLPFIAALGNAESTSIVIESFVWEDGCGGSAVGYQGEFRIHNLCRDGGTRLFLASDSIFLKPIRPNPVRDVVEVEYGIIEEGPTQLFLVNQSGEQVQTLVKASLLPGRYAVPLNVPMLASGQYYVVLQTPTRIVAQPLSVQK